MRIRNHAQETKVEQQMTAMIDVVFQLLTFFVMSFQVAVNEGDFSIKMPLGIICPSGLVEPSLPLKLQMFSDVNGELTSIRLNSTPLPEANRWDALRNKVFSLVGKPSPDSSFAEPEVEISCDSQLKYAYVIDAITAVSSYPNGSGGYVKLINKVKFAAPRNRG